MGDKKFDFIIIGGGIVGLSSAYKLKSQFPEMKILVIEKESEVGIHQTGHNSGVIHSGIYYKPGTFKAKNCVEGRKELVEFAKKYHVSHDICGKVIVATQENQLDHLNKVYDNGIANKVEGLEKIGPNQIKEIEPYVEGIKGIWVPGTGIIDFAGIAKMLKKILEKDNSRNKVLNDCEAQDFIHEGDIIKVKTNKGVFDAKYLISCAGLYSDRIAKKEGQKIDSAILGFRGDYYELSDKGMKKVKNLIYPVPDPRFPFLGVHFTRMVSGDVECGPNAVFTFKREGYNKTDFSLKDTTEALTFPGTMRFFYKHWKYGIAEYRRAWSKSMFLKTLQTLIPSLEMDDIKPGRSGVRAMALTSRGNMIDDFKIYHRENAIHVLNSPSPAATASLAIGKEIAKTVKDRFNL